MGGGSFQPVTYYYHSDHLGSPNWVTDRRGRVHERLEYFPYGELWREQLDEGGRPQLEQFRFTGKEYDEERWIQPATVARSILHVLDLPADATIPELMVRPVPPRG